MPNQIAVDKRTEGYWDNSLWHKLLIYTVLSFLPLAGAFAAFGIASLPLIAGVVAFIVVKTYGEWLWGSAIFGYLNGLSSCFGIGIITGYALDSMGLHPVGTYPAITLFGLPVVAALLLAPWAYRLKGNQSSLTEGKASSHLTRRLKVAVVLGAVFALIPVTVYVFIMLA